MENNLTPKGLTTCSRRIHQSEEHVLLKFTEGSSDKFWAAIPDNGNYIIIWGRNGKTPQKSQIVSPYVAYDRLQEKLNKGYDFCKTNELLYLFQTNPKWFDKVEGSSQFNSAVKAQKLSLELMSKDNGTPKKSKLKI